MLHACNHYDKHYQTYIDVGSVLKPANGNYKSAIRISSYYMHIARGTSHIGRLSLTFGQYMYV